MTECYLLDPEIVKQVEWQGDAETYDSELRSLGPIGEPFIAQNPYVSDSRPFYFIDQIPETEQCIVWMYREEWQAKYFPVDWQPSDGYLTLEIQIPQFIWRKNSDLDRAMTFEENIFGTFKPDSWQAQHELIWYMDPRFNPLDDKVWAISCKPVGKPILGIMDMGYVTPEVEIEYNPDLPKFELDLDAMMPAYWELINTCAYRLDPIYETEQPLYVVQIKPKYRAPKSWTWMGVITPSWKVTANKDLPELDLELNLDFAWHDLFYEHVWFLDTEFLYPGQEDLWVVKAKATTNCLGTKRQGLISPKYKKIVNPDLGGVDFTLDKNFKVEDLGYEHLWYLHKDHHPDTEQPIWAAKIIFTQNVLGPKHHQEVRPNYIQRLATETKDLVFELDIDKIPYYDFIYTNCLYMKNVKADVLVAEIDFVTDPQGSKNIGYISPIPTIEYNTEVNNIKFNADYEIPFDDRNYKHVWYLKNADKTLIWLARMSITRKPKGEKLVGYVEPILPKHLDVFFISYKEKNAESNWLRVKKVAPWAKRIKDVNGIFAAHKLAARQSETDMFYVVDGDAYLVDGFTFDFQPGIFERDFTYIWMTTNPFNNLSYGYGGVKLFNRNNFLNAKKWTTLDLTTTISKHVKIMNKVSNITRFNTDEFSTWRSAVRETVKLLHNLAANPDNKEQKERLRVWETEIDIRAKYAKFFRDGCEFGRDFYKNNKKNTNILVKINDFSWLRSQFDTRIINIS